MASKAKSGKVRSGQATFAKYGRDHMAELGKLGGKTTKERHGSEHYARISGIGLVVRQQHKAAIIEERRKKYGC